jgi:hypothetical protein
MTYNEYYLLVEKQALLLGYTEKQISMFNVDIQECWEENISIEECIERVF